MSGAWGISEIVALVNLYALMRGHVDRGQPYNKAQMIRDIQGNDVPGEAGPLQMRSKGSIEMKLMNVTAAVEALGRADLSMAEHGYRPMPNMQKALKDYVAEWIKEQKRRPIDPIDRRELNDMLADDDPAVDCFRGSA